MINMSPLNICKHFLLLKCLLLLFLIFSDKALSAEWYTCETNSKFRFRLARCDLAKCVRSSESSKNKSEVVLSQTRLHALKIGGKNPTSSKQYNVWGQKHPFVNNKRRQKSCFFSGRPRPFFEYLVMTRDELESGGHDPCLWSHFWTIQLVEYDI